jgi:hypothetical protein
MFPIWEQGDGGTFSFGDLGLGTTPIMRYDLSSILVQEGEGCSRWGEFGVRRYLGTASRKLMQDGVGIAY